MSELSDLSDFRFKKGSELRIELRSLVTSLSECEGGLGTRAADEGGEDKDDDDASSPRLGTDELETEGREEVDVSEGFWGLGGGGRRLYCEYSVYGPKSFQSSIRLQCKALDDG